MLRITRKPKGHTTLDKKDSWNGIVNNLHITLGLVATFMGATIGAGVFVQTLFGKMVLAVLMAIEMLFMAFFVVLLAAAYLHAMQKLKE